jgi:uncharacterized membrane protein YqhA
MKKAIIKIRRWIFMPVYFFLAVALCATVWAGCGCPEAVLLAEDLFDL